MASEKVDGVLYTRRDNFAWITAGGDNHVGGAQEVGVAGMWVDADGIVLLTTNIEAGRVDEEELQSLDVEIFAWPWYKDADEEMRRFVGRRQGVSDFGAAGLPNRQGDLAPLRYELLPEEETRYRELGREVAVAIEAAADATKKGETEFEVAARLNSRLLSRGIEPTVTLVAADGRIERYRHPIPTHAAIDRYVMLITCARRHGLIAAATRLVHFGELPHDLDQRQQAVVHVDAGIIKATRPGISASDLFSAACDLYAEAGYPGEWELHHQGGAIGYANREWTAAPHQQEKVRARQAFAWNPSVTGTKSEDTVLVTPQGHEVLTVGNGSWPQRRVVIDGVGIDRPDILRK